MAWSTVSWAYKDVITSAKLAQMVENLRVHDHATVDQGGMFVGGTWSPTWTGSTTNPAAGHTLDGRYVKAGRLVSCWVRVTVAAVGIGTGNYSWALPVAAVAGATSRPVLGVARLKDASGAAIWSGTVFLSTLTTIQLRNAGGIGGNATGVAEFTWDNATPVVPAVGDTYDMTFSYESAT